MCTEDLERTGEENVVVCLTIIFQMVKWWNKEELRKCRSPAWNLGGVLILTVFVDCNEIMLGCGKVYQCATRRRV
jgi:hypothetical protein